MNLLLDTPPTHLDMQGKEYPINWGYRAFILIEMCMFDETLNEEQKLDNAMDIFYPEGYPEDLEAAANYLIWFYQCGENAKNAESNKSGGAGHVQRCYDFEQDAPFIFSAFLTQYSIDLSNTPNYELHWWKFRAMFDSLSEEHKFCKIMYYRTAKTGNMNKQQRAFINDMKKLYALHVQDSTGDHKIKLAQRNQKMKDYVRNRISEVDNAKHGQES